ncbi:MAG: hypothetical protein R3E96_08050 [Planctomycetota bacterium]
MRISINGFGRRIGRNVFRILQNTPAWRSCTSTTWTDPATLAQPAQ